MRFIILITILNQHESLYHMKEIQVYLKIQYAKFGIDMNLVQFVTIGT